jgi:hypothetical protein
MPHVTHDDLKMMVEAMEWANREHIHINYDDHSDSGLKEEAMSQRFNMALARARELVEEVEVQAAVDGVMRRAERLKRADGCEKCVLSRWGPGAIDDPLSLAAGGRPWTDCECQYRDAEPDPVRQALEKIIHAEAATEEERRENGMMEECADLARKAMEGK